MINKNKINPIHFVRVTQFLSMSDSQLKTLRKAALEQGMSVTRFVQAGQPGLKKKLRLKKIADPRGVK